MNAGVSTIGATVGWDQTSISQGFLDVAEEADRYLREVRSKMQARPAYGGVFDDHLAKFYVYNYLCGKVFLESRDSLLQELRQMLQHAVPPPHEVFDAERFERHRKFYIQELMSRYERGDC